MFALKVRAILLTRNLAAASTRFEPIYFRLLGQLHCHDSLIKVRRQSSVCKPLPRRPLFRRCPEILHVQERSQMRTRGHQ